MTRLEWAAAWDDLLDREEGARRALAHTHGVEAQLRDALKQVGELGRRQSDELYALWEERGKLANQRPE